MPGTVRTLLYIACVAGVGCGSSEPATKSLSDRLSEAQAVKDPAARAAKMCALAKQLGDAKDISGQDTALKGAV